MKKILTVLLLITVLISACSKTTKHSAGTWTFKSQTYSPTFANYVLGAFTAYTQENLPTGSLAFTFFDTTEKPHYDTLGINIFLTPTATPPRMGTHTYRLSSVNPPDSGYVYVVMTDTSAARSYKSVRSSSNTITVSFDGKITQVDVSGITLMKDNNPADSSTLTAHITQLNYK